MSALDLTAQVLDPHSCTLCADDGRTETATHHSVMPWGTAVYLCDPHEMQRVERAPLWRSAKIKALLAELRGGL